MKRVMSSRRDAVSRKTSRKAGGMEFIDRLYLATHLNMVSLTDCRQS
jgi:hypothetical protein